MQEAKAFSIESEQPLRLHWHYVSAESNMPSPLGDTEGFDPLVYAGSLIPFNGMRIPIVQGSPGSPQIGLDVHTMTDPPVGWTGRVLLLSERIQEMKASGIYLPGFVGYQEWQQEHGPFAQANKIMDEDKRWKARVEGVLQQILAAVKK
jgi:hypothetical protein